jgi:hypothetical protein
VRCMHACASAPSSSCSVSPGRKGTNAKPQRAPAQRVTVADGATPSASPSTAAQADGSRSRASPKCSSDTRRRPVREGVGAAASAGIASTSRWRMSRKLARERSAGAQVCALRSCTQPAPAVTVAQGGCAQGGVVAGASPTASICRFEADAPATARVSAGGAAVCSRKGAARACVRVRDRQRQHRQRTAQLPQRAHAQPQRPSVARAAARAQKRSAQRRGTGTRTSGRVVSVGSAEQLPRRVRDLTA